MTTAQKRLLVVLVLTLVTALGGRELLRDHHQRLADNAAQSQQRRLFGCDAHGGTPTAVVLTTSGTTYTLVRNAKPDEGAKSATTWRLKTPIDFAADDDLVDAFVQAACALETLGPIRAKPDEPPLDLQLFHLDQPRHEVTMVWDTNTSVSVSVGDISGFNNHVYVRRNDSQEIDQVDGAFNYHIERSLTAWRQKRPFVGMVGQDIQTVDITLSGPGAGHYRLDRGPNDTFTVTPHKDLARPADGAKAKEWLAALLDVRAEDFVAERADEAARKRFGLSKPSAVVQLSMADKSQRTLRLGQLRLGEKTHTFAQVDDQDSPIMRLATDELYQKIRDGAGGLEDMRVLHLDLSAVAKVVVTEGSQTATYIRTEPSATTPATWHVGAAAADASAPQLDQQKFIGALRRLVQMRAATIITRHATAEDLRHGALLVPRHTVALLTANDQPLEILWVGRKEGGQTWLTNDKKQIIYSVYEGTVEAFSADIDNFLTAPGEQDVATVPKAQ